MNLTILILIGIVLIVLTSIISVYFSRSYKPIKQWKNNQQYVFSGVTRQGHMVLAEFNQNRSIFNKDTIGEEQIYKANRVYTSELKIGHVYSFFNERHLDTNEVVTTEISHSAFASAV